MIICFECQPGTKRLLDELVMSGGYADYSDVLAAAVSNQALLHSKVEEHGTLILGDADEKVAVSPLGDEGSNRPAPRQARESVQSARPSRRQPASAGVPHASVGVPRLFVLNGLSAPGESAVLPDDVWVAGQEIPISRWLFGQYNKLLPAKASCRALAHLLEANSEGATLATAPMEIAEAAAHLGDYLVGLDDANGVGRDEALATAFPTTGPGSDKSRLRFASQFVAWANRHGQLSGLPVGLKLINRTNHKEPRIQLTDAGWKFALSTNPVLDGDGPHKPSRLSDEECLLLLDHIATAVPTEDFAYRAVLKGIHAGANTPESLDDFLVRTYPAGAEQLTKEFVATQRSGVVSRMIDMGMLSRVRDGARVTYAVSERARDYITQESRK